jgi:nitrilase
MPNKQAPNDHLRVGLVQIAPIWLNKTATIQKAVEYIVHAAEKKCQIAVFGEAFLPGYPFWTELTDGAVFNSAVQKELFSFYSGQAVHIPSGDLYPVCQAAERHKIHVVIGTIERAADRGGHSLYCSLVYIDPTGTIRNVHRKLCPTYDERLTWSPGDGHGLQVFPVQNFTLGALNCWENWMPLSRTALYGLGEDLHIAIWPGSKRNTEDITRFMALEGRSYVISVGSLMRRSDIPTDMPHVEKILDKAPDLLADGGSCAAGPDGRWLIEPFVGEEALLIADLDHGLVRRERQNFDAAGHYSRPDVTRLIVNRTRQNILEIDGETEPN